MMLLIVYRISEQLLIKWVSFKIQDLGLTLISYKERGGSHKQL